MIEAALLLVRLILGLAAILCMGAALAAWLAPALSRPLRLAAGLGLGALLLTLWMLALSALGLSFHLLLILGPPLALLGGLWAGKKIFGGRGQGSQTLAPSLKAFQPFQGWDWLFIGLLAALFLFAFLRAGVYPLWSWDAISTWGFKAKVFYLRGNVDLQGFEAHNYYPNLLPLLLTYLYLCLGQVNDHLVKLVFPLWGGGLLMMLYGILAGLGLTRRQALGTTCFFALNGLTFTAHLHLAYADLTLTYFTLGAAGLIYLWLRNAAPAGALPLAALFCAGLTWCKFEGAPLAGTIILAAGLTLIWLRPPGLGRRLLALGWPLAGLLVGYLPWRLYALAHGIETGADHILGVYPRQFLQALPAFLWALVNPAFFGLLWPAAALALIFSGRKIFTSPRFFLPLFLGGNFLAILLAYAVAPTSPFEFHLYLRATLDRLLFHLTPLAALLIGEGLKDLGGGPRT
jgi:hypothetical protein